MLRLFFKTKTNKNGFKTLEYDFRDQINLALKQTSPHLQIFNPCMSMPTKKELKINNREYRIQSIAMSNV